MVYGEILSTERTYVENLNKLLQYFVHPLKSTKTFGITQDKVRLAVYRSSQYTTILLFVTNVCFLTLSCGAAQVNTMFGNVEILANFHRVLLGELEQRPARAAELLLRYADFLKVSG